MHQVSASQIKAARAMLDWSQDDLAATAGLSVTTVRNFESGDMSPRSTTANEIRKAIENAGLEFIESEGVRRRIDEVKIYQGSDSCDRFFGDMLQTVKEKGGEIISVFKSQEIMAQICSIKCGKLERLEQLSEFANIKCLLSEILEPLLSASSCQFRTILKQHLGPTSYFVYGDKHAFVVIEGSSVFKFVVFRSFGLAQSYRDYFISLWEMAPPIFIEVKNPDYRVGT